MIYLLFIADSRARYLYSWLIAEKHCHENLRIGGAKGKFQIEGRARCKDFYIGFIHVVGSAPMHVPKTSTTLNHIINPSSEIDPHILMLNSLNDHYLFAHSLKMKLHVIYETYLWDMMNHFSYSKDHRNAFKEWSLWYEWHVFYLNRKVDSLILTTPYTVLTTPFFWRAGDASWKTLTQNMSNFVREVSQRYQIRLTADSIHPSKVGSASIWQQVLSSSVLEK